jgi:hypothetical protein
LRVKPFGFTKNNNCWIVAIMARSPEDASHFWRGTGWIDVGRNLTPAPGTPPSDGSNGANHAAAG